MPKLPYLRLSTAYIYPALWQAWWLALVIGFTHFFYRASLSPSVCVVCVSAACCVKQCAPTVRTRRVGVFCCEKRALCVREGQNFLVCKSAETALASAACRASAGAAEKRAK